MWRISSSAIEPFQCFLGKVLYKMNTSPRRWSLSGSDVGLPFSCGFPYSHGDNKGKHCHSYDYFHMGLSMFHVHMGPFFVYKGTKMSFKWMMTGGSPYDLGFSGSAPSVTVKELGFGVSSVSDLHRVKKNVAVIVAKDMCTWWFIPRIVSGLVDPGYEWDKWGQSPLITRVITHLLSGMNHQVDFSLKHAVLTQTNGQLMKERNMGYLLGYRYSVVLQVGHQRISSRNIKIYQDYPHVNLGTGSVHPWFPVFHGWKGSV